jgi:hypothetical protein
MEIIIRDLQRKLEDVKVETSNEEQDNLLANIELMIEKEIFPLFDDMRVREEEYSLIYNSAAFVALRYNLSDFIGNCYDANATEIIITIPENKELTNGKVAVTISDNGDGLPSSMLPTNEKTENIYGKRYSEILDGKSQINSGKKAQDLGGHGGAGLGLARASIFLRKKDGDIHLDKNSSGPGAKITLESQQPQGALDTHLRLATAFGKIKDEQIKKIERAEAEILKKQKIIYFAKEDDPANDSTLLPNSHSEITNLDNVTPPSSPTPSSSTNNDSELSDFDMMSPSVALSNSEQSDFDIISPSLISSNSELYDFNTPASPRVDDNLTQKIISSLEDLESTFKRVNSQNKAAITQLTIENIRDVNNNEGFTPSKKIQEMQKLLEGLNSKISPQGGNVAGLSFFSSHKVVTALIKQVKEEYQLRTKEELENDNSPKPKIKKW